MRTLFCFDGGPGHFGPMIPIARAVERAGHGVGVACRPHVVPLVQGAGFVAFGIVPATRVGPVTRTALKEVDVGREEGDVLRHLTSRTPQRCRSLRAFMEDWRPDVVVAEESNFGALMAAEATGVPYATVLVLAAGSFLRPDLVAGTLDRIRGEMGLAPDPGLLARGRYLVLCPFPPRLRDPAFALADTTRLYRPVDVPRHRGDPPPWARRLAGAPAVYVTLGTEFNVESGDLFERVLAGLGDLPVNVLVTVGDAIDPAELGPRPAHITVERYVPQAEVLPHSDLVVFHGGSGTLTGALAHGLPMVVLAMGADQPANVARCEALGLGISLDPVRVTPDDVRANVAAVLADARYRRGAERFGVEMAAQPDPSTAVALLERLALGGPPPVGGGGHAPGRG